MRLTDYQINAIIQNAKIVFGQNCKIYLFGSRVDDNKHGGDIDLFIECSETYNTFSNEIEFVGKLQNMIGQQKIDLVIKTLDKDDKRLIVSEALTKGILLS